MQLIQVTNSSLAQKFIQTAVLLNKADKNWIQPLDNDINQVFDKQKNKAFRFGELIRWVLVDDNQQLIGRVAAFINKKYKNKGDDIPVGGMGFFECINNQTAANLLFDAAKNWLQSKGMQAMDGPINFGERDRWWGLQTEGNRPPLYCLAYNPPYYVDLFTKYGFKVFYNQICLGFDIQLPLAQKIFDRYNALIANPAFTCRTYQKNKLVQYATDFATVYNKAWAGHGGLKEMPKEQAILMFKKMQAIVDPSIMYFAYFNDEPIGIFLNIPNINDYFKHFNGKFGLLQKLRFLYMQKFKKTNRFSGLIFGVVPEYHGKGVDCLLIATSAKILQKPPYVYKEMEMQWIGDFNPKMLNVADSFGDTYRSRNLSTMRFLFDAEKEFKRHPII
jgi:hypothetical protein